MKETKATTGLANNQVKKDLKDAERTAVFIRRMEYATSMKRQMKLDKNLKDQMKKIAMIQEWWKTMFKIIKLQKNIRGFLFRKKLMNNLEHQEKLLQFITEFDNIHNYHLYKQFFDNLKKKADYEKAKQMERCEDFGEKLDNLEKLNNAKKMKEILDRWKKAAFDKKKDTLDNFATVLNKVLNDKIQKNRLDTLNELKDNIDEREKEMDDKLKDYLKRKAKKDFLEHLKKAHRLNKFLNNAKNKIDDRLKKEAFDKLKSNDEYEKLKKFSDNLENLINDHINKDDLSAKKDLMDKLKNIANKNKLKEAFDKWKDLVNEQKKINKIIRKLKRKKEEENKNKFKIIGVNNFDLLSDKPELSRNKGGMFMTSENDVNILAPEKLFSKGSEQNFSLLAPEKIKFNFGDPYSKNYIIDKDNVLDQLDDIDNYLKNKKLKDAFDKWKEETDLKNILDKLKNYQKKKLDNEKGKNTEFFVEKVNDIIFKAQKRNDDDTKKDFLDKLKKNSDISNALQKADNILTNAKKRNDDNKKKDFLDKLKNKSDKDNAIEKVNDILFEAKKRNDDDKKKDFLDKLRKKSDVDNAIEKVDNILNTLQKKDEENTKKDFLDKLKKNSDVVNAIEKVDNFMINKLKKDAFDELKKNAGLSEGLRKLDKLYNDHLKKEFFDNLKNIENLGKASQILDDIIKRKLQKKLLVRLNNKNDIAKAADDLEKLIDDKLKKIALDALKINKDNENLRNSLKKWKEQCEKEEIKEKLKDYLDKKNAFNNWKDVNDHSKILSDLTKLKKNKVLGDLINDTDAKKNQNLLQKYFDKWKKKNNDRNRSKRISDRKKYAKSRSKSKNKQNKKNKKNKKLLRQAFDKWRDIALFKSKKNVLDKMKKNKVKNNNLKNKPDDRDELLDKLKKKCLQVLLNIYKRQRNILLKKYFDKWYRNRNNNNFLSNNSIVDSEQFQPKYFNQKHNIYKENNPNFLKQKYLKNFRKDQEPEISPEEYENNIPNTKPKYEDLSEVSSGNNSDCDMILIETKKETKTPINYTSQSFFIDKNLSNPLNNKNDYQVSTHITNQLPMTMKGDFISLIEENPKILKQKNPRIQVTNATCELEQIIDEDKDLDEDFGPEEIDTEITKLKSNYNISKNKIITKVIQNCDHDLYASKKPFKSKKSPWYSVSIPLNENEAKWEFLNNIQGEREKTNLNKFELIQEEKNTIEMPTISPEKDKTINPRLPRFENKRANYRLREINYTQFYRSPIKNDNNRYGIDSFISSTTKAIRRPDENARNFNKSFVYDLKGRNQYDARTRYTNNILMGKGKKEKGLKHNKFSRSSGNVEDSDECEDCYDIDNNAYYKKK